MASQCSMSPSRNGGAPANNSSSSSSSSGVTQKAKAKGKKGRFRGISLTALATQNDDSRHSRLARDILDNMHRVAVDSLNRSHRLERASTDPKEDALLRIFPCLTRDLVKIIIRVGGNHIVVPTLNPVVTSQDVIPEFDDVLNREVDADLYSDHELDKDLESPALPEAEPYGFSDDEVDADEENFGEDYAEWENQ